MKKSISSFSEFKRVVKRNLKHKEVYCTRYGFYFRTNKCDFFYSCRSFVDRRRVFEFMREFQIVLYDLEVAHESI